MKIILGTKTKEQILKEYAKQGINISNYAKDMLDKVKFSKKKQSIELKVVTVADLGFPNGATYKEIIEKAEEQGLYLCPQETAAYLRLDYKQELYDWAVVASESVTGAAGYPSVFYVSRHGDGVWLDGSWAKPAHEWHSGSGFVFSLRKSETKKLKASDSLELRLLETRIKELEIKMGKLEKIINIK